MENNVYVIRKDGEYLVAKPYSDTRFLRWSGSAYDGIRIHSPNKAKALADIVGGTVFKFNPLTGAVSV